MTLAVSIAQSGSNNTTFRNRLINGAMQIAQRATSGTSGSTVPTTTATYPSLDRWYAYATGATVTVAQVAGTVPIKNNLAVTGAASVTAVGVGQRIEQLNSYDLAGSTATLSVNISNTLLTTVTWTASYATSADTWSAKTQIATGTFTVTSSLVNYTANISIPSAATTGIEILFTVGAQISGTWTIGNVQLEAGSTASPFEYRSYGTELALCQRYYEKSYNIDVVPGTATSVNARLTTNIATISGSSADRNMLLGSAYAVTKRTTPAVVFYNVVAGTINAISSYSGGVSYTVSTYNGGGATSIAYYIGTATSPAGTEACNYQFTASAEL
jgi:hypothetical protein